MGERLAPLKAAQILNKDGLNGLGGLQQMISARNVGGNQRVFEPIQLIKSWC